MGTTIKSLSLVSVLLFLFTTSSARQRPVYADLFDAAASRHFQEVDIHNAPIEELNPANQVQERRIRQTVANDLSTLLAQLSEKANFTPNTLEHILNDYLELPFTVKQTDMRLEVDPNSLKMLPFSADVNSVRHLRKQLHNCEVRRQAEEARVAAERKAAGSLSRYKLYQKVAAEEERLAAERKAAGSLSRYKLYQKAKQTELVRQAQDELLAAELEKCMDKIDAMAEETVTDLSAPAQCTLNFTFEDFTHRLHDHYQLWESDENSCWSDGDYVTVRERHTGTFKAGVYRRPHDHELHFIDYTNGTTSLTPAWIDEIHTLPRITIDNDTLWCRFEEALRHYMGYTVLIRRTDHNSYQVFVSWGGWAQKWVDQPQRINKAVVARDHALLLGNRDKRVVTERIKGPLLKTCTYEDMIKNTLNVN